MFRKRNRIYRVLFICLLLVLLSATAACQSTSNEAASEPQASLSDPDDSPAPTEEPTAAPSPTTGPTEEPPTATVPPTPEPTEEPQISYQDPSELPTARGLHAMAYDSESDRIIMFGGELEEINTYKNGGETWAYDAGNNLWTQTLPAKEPVGVWGPAMAYDGESDRVIMVGGKDENHDHQQITCAYDYNTNSWSEGAANPEIGSSAAMVYDSESDRMILFGGSLGTFGGGFQNKTWAYDFNTDSWENMEPDNSPEERVWHNMVYDVESDRVIVWEGEGDITENVWTYDYNANSWTEHDPDGVPVIAGFLGFGAMVYDAESDRAISFGGGWYSGARITDALWAYDYNTDTWTEMTPDTGPGGRTSHNMAYNSALDLVILFGGRNETFYKYSQETWLYDFNTNTWTNMTAEQD